jgi:peptidoglycan/LPS O-acetylase OafA/YrhL
MTRARLYFPRLDGLRFLAFMLVLIHHSLYAAQVPGWETLHRFGWMGVDLFLCLSAFLFARLLAVEFQETGRITVWFFYVRRALRIWPLYFVFVAAVFAISIATAGWSRALAVAGLALFTFTDNVRTMALGYNELVRWTSHLWTISYEEQFYAVIPWVLWAFYRGSRRASVVALGVAALVGSGIRAWMIVRGVGHPAIWVLPLTHFEAILGGLAIGLGLLDPFARRLGAWIVLALGLLALWYVTRLPDVSEIQWKLMVTYPLVGAGVSLIVLAALQEAVGPLAILESRVLRYLGKISFGLYVVHLAMAQAALTLLDMLITPSHWLLYPCLAVTMTLLATVAVSALSYTVLERPFLQLKGRFTLVPSRPL